VLYTLTFDGIPIGRVDLNGSPRAVGTLIPLSAFDDFRVRVVARRLGLALRVSGSRRVNPSVVSSALSRALLGAVRVQERLGLRDLRGANVAIVRIVVVEFPRDRWPVVVAELRDQAAPSRSELAPLVGGPGERSRPAA